MALVEESGRNVQRCGLLLHDLLRDYPERATLAQDLKVCEQEGDRITHDIIHRLAGRGRVRAPFDAGDGYALATALDDIVDHSEQVAAQLGLYGVEAPMEQAVEFTEVLVGAGEQIAQALRCLRTTPSWARTWSRSTASRTRATACSATASPRCSPAASTRWW